MPRLGVTNWTWSTSRGIPAAACPWCPPSAVPTRSGWHESTSDIAASPAPRLRTQVSAQTRPDRRDGLVPPVLAGDIFGEAGLQRGAEPGQVQVAVDAADLAAADRL